MKLALFLVSILPLFLTCAIFSGPISFRTAAFQLSVNRTGAVTALVDLERKINYLAPSVAAPLLSVRIGKNLLPPRRAELNDQILTLEFDSSVVARIAFVETNTYLALELLSVTPAEKIDLIVWGPFPTTLNQVIGETVGVVQGKDFALGIQSLNPKTIGGFPWTENDCMPQIDLFEQENLADLSESGKRYVLYRVEAAKPEEFGSTLQAYCRNRNQARIIENWEHQQYTAPAFPDGGVAGSKIALFGCPPDQILPTIAAIEVGENLPHPQIDGEWAKTARSASAAYLILGFSADNIDRALEIAQQAGLRYLYHPDPFANWGHFDLKKTDFPNGPASLQHCVQVAEKQGIMLGVHTLSNFITPNDPYVTPVPDPRLAVVGASRLAENVDAGQTEITIESPSFFNQFQNNHLKTVVVGSELIQYAAVSERSPWKLLDCRRGAFGTRPAAHTTGDSIAKLADHAYQVFLSNASLSIEMAERLAGLFNATGLRQISFDGLEGNRSTGMGNYGEILFTNTWYQALAPHLQQHFIADASRTSHFFWHIYTRMNWGEPWYAGFRESQTEYRLKNQAYFKRNLMPAMLGWFKMTAETSLEDIEWMLARSAGFHAGYGFVTDFQTLEQNQISALILNTLSQWEHARMAHAFTDDQRSRMQDIQREFHLRSVSEKEWALMPVFSWKLQHTPVRQPGEPPFSRINFTNPVSQPVSLIFSAAAGRAENISLKIDQRQLRLDVSLNEGDILKYSGGDQAIRYNRHWKKLNAIPVNPEFFNLGTGEHSLELAADFGRATTSRLKLEIRLWGPGEKCVAQTP